MVEVGYIQFLEVPYGGEGGSREHVGAGGSKEAGAGSSWGDLLHRLVNGGRWVHPIP